jgi:hypothetical protein
MSRLVRWSLLPLLWFASSALAQDAGAPQKPETEQPEVLISGKVRHGGWGAPVVQISTVRDRAAVFVGGRGGWLINGRFTIGGGGFGLVSDIPAPDAAQPAGASLDLEMGYGGLWLEYTLAPARLLHVSIGTLIGGGGLTLTHHDGGSFDGSTDSFFVLEPAVVAELNVASFVRADLGVAYRAISGVNMGGLSYADVSGFSGVVLVKFGKF